MTQIRQNVQAMLSEEAIHKRVKEMARLIEADYAGKDLVAIGLLKGAYPFMADLTRALDLDIQVGFMTVSSYGSGVESSGRVKIVQDIDCAIDNKDVLIIEDIVDTGHTLVAVLEHLRSRSPASLRVCALLDKPSRRKADIHAEYVCFTIEDHFVVGYGMDANGLYRNLSYVGIYTGGSCG